MTRFSVVGAGRLGTALAAGLTRKGWQLVVIADRDAAAAREARRIVARGRATTDVRLAARGGDVVIICVPDDAVETVARRLARSRDDWSGLTVFHTSGLLPAAALESLRRRGASVASLHPAQSFPEKTGGARLFRGISWAVEGDREAIRLGREIVRRLGGRAFVLREEDKPFYHAACSLASNAFVALEAASAAILEAAGAGRRPAAAILLPLVQGTLQNVKKLGWERALTGPVARGDIRTVRRHLEALASRPLESAVYRSLGMEALRLAARGKTPARRVRALSRLLEGRRLPPPAARRRSRRPVP
ncbi:MAG TPA: Rossmann-like and DUF2520 domain-containing protein [Burkholderiales bacterium]|nr:Rossmann-like and DUF2520 domain-containing protein [Burkholderiales bacterium]